MMASIGTTFPSHPSAMQQHPGIPPGHPGLAPGMAHNSSQPSGPPGGVPPHLAAHMSLSGPSSQMNPAMISGIPSGAQPNVHSLPHLSQQQAQLLQQQHLGQMGQMAIANPTLQQLQQQQRFQQIQQQQQQQRQTQQILIQQHGMYNGVPMSHVNIAALQRRMGTGHPTDQRSQAFFAQQLALQQQAAAHSQNPNGSLSMHQAQIAAIHAQQQAQQAQQSQQTQQVQQTQAQQAQQAHQTQHPHQTHQVQAAAAAAHLAQQHAQQQTQQTPSGQQTPVISGQSQGPHPTPLPQSHQQPGQTIVVPPPPSAASQGPQIQLVGQPQLSQQGPPGSVQRQNQIPPQMQPLVLQPNAIALQQHAQQQQIAAANAAALQSKNALRLMCLVKLGQFCEAVAGYIGPKSKDDVSYWIEFVARFFAPSGVFRHTIQIVDGDERTNKQFEIPLSALPRYFHTYYESGVTKLQVTIDQVLTERQLAGDRLHIESCKSSLVQWFENNSHVVATGSIRVQFDNEARMELFEFACDGHEEFISRKMVIQAALPGHNWVKEWLKVNNSSDSKQSPEMSKKSKAKQLRSPQTQPPGFTLPQSPVKANVGLTGATNQFLEVVEVMGNMNSLFSFSQTDTKMTAFGALDHFVQNITSSTLNGNGLTIMAAGPSRTHSMGQFSIGASPRVSHLPPPGSPHVDGSPVTALTQVPAMHPSQSQQGSGSGGPSANASPVGTKRRRPSGVKAEDDIISGPMSTPTPAMNTQATLQGKTKPPTPRMQKKQKVNP